jgi:hypothetical protein
MADTLVHLPPARIEGAQATARAAALLAVMCVAVHLVLVVATGPTMMTVGMLALSAVCAGCAARTRGRMGARDALVMVASGTAMVVLHLGTIHGSTHADASGAHASVAGHHHGEGAESGGDLDESALAHTLMHVGVTLSALQGSAAAVVWLGSRRRREGTYRAGAVGTP